MIRTAKVGYEQNLIADMRTHQNLFHGHYRRSLKTKQGVSNVVDENGILTRTAKKAADALNTYYHSVFTMDTDEPTAPEFPDQTEERLGDVYITEEMVLGAF